MSWQAPYNKDSGFDASKWSETTYGPLGAGACGLVTSQAWYTTARALGSGESSTAVESISTGWMGVRYMRQQTKSGGDSIVFGAELDSRTINTYAALGKPTEGEVYMVSTTGSGTTLLAATEASVASQLQTTANEVHPTSVGNLTLTGLSSSTLQLSHGSFQQIWDNSATTALATAARLAVEFCPSASAEYPSYSSVAPERSLHIDLPSSTVRRLNSSVPELELLIVNLLPAETYRDKLTAGVYFTILAYSMNALVIMGILALPWAKIKFQLPVADWHMSVAWVLAVVGLFVVFVVWIIIISTNHREAVDNFGVQISNSINSTFEMQQASAKSMVQQATRLWWHTGQATASLSVVNKWTVTLLKAFNTNNGISTLRFATQSGLEQGVNGTSAGMRVLSRPSSTACLATYIYDSTTDGVVSDASSYPDDCYYDPQFTDWYQRGRTLEDVEADFTSTYANNTWLAAVAKACSTGPNCTASSAGTTAETSWSPTVGAAGEGVWSAEWRISTLQHSLSALLQGLEGSLAIADTNAIILISSGGLTVTPALTCGDDYIQDAASQLNGETGFNWADASGTVKGHNIVSSSVNAGFVSFSSLARGQFYAIYEETLSSCLAIMLVSTFILSACIDFVWKKVNIASDVLESESEKAINEDRERIREKCDPAKSP